MAAQLSLMLTALGVGGLLGALAKALLDRRHLKFSKIFDYKEARYKALMILFYVSMKPSTYEFRQLQLRRPELTSIDDLERELDLEFHNAMLYASRDVLAGMRSFMSSKTPENWDRLASAMRKDLYL